MIAAIDLTPAEFALCYMGALLVLYGLFQLGMWWRYNRKDRR